MTLYQRCMHMIELIARCADVAWI